MSLIKNRFATALILVVILAACVHAHPNGGDNSFENNMDWPDLFSVGDQFADAFAYDQFNAQMTPPFRPSNSRSITSPPQPSRPQVQPQLQRPQAPPSTNYDPGYFQFTNAEATGMTEIEHPPSVPRSAPILTFAQEQTVDMHHGNNNGSAPWLGEPGAVHQRFESAADMAVGYRGSYEAVPAPAANAANMYGYPNAPQAQHQQWPPPPQTINSIPQQGLQGSSFDVQGSLPIPIADGRLHLPPSPPVESVPHILPTEVTNNPNYQPGMVPNTPGNMLGWINRAPAIGDRTLLSRLDTNLLAPPDTHSANRSPTSASTTGSSTRGSRRQKWEMTGDLLCHWCNAGFTTQGELTHHLRSHQPYLSRQHVCQHCSKRFQYRKDLMRHLPKHDPNRKKYYCIFKGCKYHARGFGRQDHLDRHIQTQHRIDTPQQSSRPSSNHA